MTMLEVKVKIVSNHPEIGSELTLTLDDDFIEFDDVISAVECQIFETYGKNLYYQQDFEILNAEDICEQLIDEEF